MKRLVLVEDAPWRAQNNLLELKERGVKIEKIFYFTLEEDIPDEYKKMKSNLEQVLEIQVDRINTSNFYNKVDHYFADEEVFILVDLNLDDANTFEERINVQYANSKQNKGSGKIWFYTTGGKELKSMLVKNFRGQLIDVTGFSNNQLSWDTDKILNIAEER